MSDYLVEKSQADSIKEGEELQLTTDPTDQKLTDIDGTRPSSKTTGSATSASFASTSRSSPSSPPLSFSLRASRG